MYLRLPALDCRDMTFDGLAGARFRLARSAYGDGRFAIFELDSI